MLLRSAAAAAAATAAVMSWSGLESFGGGTGRSGTPFLLEDAFRWVDLSAVWRDAGGAGCAVRTVAVEDVEGVDYHV